MRDKYKNNKTKQKHKKQRSVVRTAAPPSATPLPDTGHSHNCHLSRKGRSCNCHYPTTRALHTTAIHPIQHGTPTQLSLILHNAGQPHSCQVSESHTTQKARGTPCYLPSCPSNSSKKAKWGTWGENEKMTVQSTNCICNHSGKFTEKDGFPPPHMGVSPDPTLREVEGEVRVGAVSLAVTPRTIQWARGEGSCRHQPCSLSQMRVGEGRPGRSKLCQAARP